jgi:hypothetical protein
MQLEHNLNAKKQRKRLPRNYLQGELPPNLNIPPIVERCFVSLRPLDATVRELDLRLTAQAPANQGISS